MATLDAWAIYWNKALGQSEQGLTYLQARGIGPEEIQAYCLGFADFRTGFLRSTAIVLPLLDYYQQVVGFTFNCLEGGPKYYHSGLPHRGRWLYGLHLPPKPEVPPILVEGQYDSIQLRKLGYPAYALLGSKLSLWQAAHLLFLSKPHQVVVVYPDNDNQGLAFQASQQLARLGIRTLTPPLPYLPWHGPKDDPDDLARTDADYLRDQIQRARPTLEKKKDAKRSRKSAVVDNWLHGYG